MGISDRKERERHEMKELILNAAIKLYVRDGFDKLSIRAIANEIEYSPATIYLYFKDKDDIFYDIHRYAFSKFLAVLKTADHIKNPYERLQASSRLYIQFAMEHPHLYDVMFIQAAPMKKIEVNNDGWKAGEMSYDWLRQTVLECIEAGIFKNADVELATFTIWSQIHGVASLYLRGRLALFPPEYIESLMFGSCIDITSRYTKK